MKKLLMLVLIFLFAGCVSITNQKKNTIHLDESSNGKIVTAAINQKVIIRLKGNPTTGYSWVQNTFNPKFFILLKKDYISNEKNKNMSGIGGVYTFEFLTKQVGRVDLNFDYKRAWENKASAKVYKVTFDIK